MLYNYNSEIIHVSYCINNTPYVAVCENRTFVQRVNRHISCNAITQVRVRTRAWSVTPVVVVTDNKSNAETIEWALAHVACVRVRASVRRFAS